jgi:hypothetical protein
MRCAGLPRASIRRGRGCRSGGAQRPFPQPLPRESAAFWWFPIARYAVWFLTNSPVHELSHLAGVYAGGGRVTQTRLLTRFWRGECDIAWVHAEQVAFRTFEIHHAEGNGPRKPQIWDVDDSGDELVLKDRHGD